MLIMSKIARIHKGKTAHRIHFISEWLEHRGASQIDLAEAVDVSAGTVSKWCNRSVMPTNENLAAIATFLHIEPNDLFHDPADDWLARMFKNRSAEEKDKMRTVLETVFPIDKAANGQ
jgi:transcriptional regulator with XRE-family HTH domain